MLILSGTVYTLVGIKNKMLHISLSATYLASLAVTVLILYVMNFPVSNAIQGAYLVAVVMTGLILGGASLIFTEITEGLGCLLGGFCISMWFLVLKPGGLISSVSGVSVFIAVFSIVAFSTSFSHITRPYGLMVFTSFGGATVLVVGIDCFSRAGLKEFWAYIWNVNGNLFPLGATTYPHTRGLKVEIAAIILFFLAGLISQMKVWKVVKELREKRTAERLEGERTVEQEEARRGRLIEERIQRDRQRWEAVYGEQDVEKSIDRPRDSGLGDMDSQRKGPLSTVNSERNSKEDAIEMAEISPMPTPTETETNGIMKSKSGKEGTVTVRVARDVEPPQIIDENGKRMYFFQDRLSYTARSSYASPSSYVKPEQDDLTQKKPSFEKRESMKTTAVPEVVPLPFKVPDDKFEDDRSSVATFADDEQASQRRFSASRLSATGSMLLRKLSKRSQRSSKRLSIGDNNYSTEELVIPHEVEDDRASSVAATLDDLSVDEEIRSVRSSLAFDQDTEPEVISNEPEKDALKETLEVASVAENHDYMIADNVDSSPKELPEISASSRSLTSSTDPKIDNQTEKTPAVVLTSIEKPTLARDSMSSAEDPRPSSLTKDRLPARFSKVAMSYRTNEWAKHLSSADSPDLEELPVAIGHVQEESGTNKEIAVPVNVEELQQTSESVANPARTLSQISANKSPKLSPPKSHLATSAPSRSESWTDESPILQRSASHQSLQTQPLQLYNRTTSHRNSSTPNVPYQIIESPIEHTYSPSHPYGNNAALHGRDTLARGMSRSSSVQASTPGLYNSSLNTGSISDVNLQPQSPSALGRLEREKMSISQRQSVIRQASYTSQSTNSRQNIFDSHQPKRQSSIPSSVSREQQLAMWRSSIQQDIKTSTPVNHTLERQRSALWQERQAEGQKKVREERRKGERDSAFDEQMRRGNMLDAHRDALRKMQGIANKNAQ